MVRLDPTVAVTGDMGRHDGHGLKAVSVAELLEREAASGTPLRLNWPVWCLDPQGGVRDWDGDEWPTGELPALTDEVLAKLDARGGGGTADSGVKHLVTDGGRQENSMGGVSASGMARELAGDGSGGGELGEESNGLPKRQARAYPPAPRKLWEPDVEMLGRVLRGLRGLK